MPDSIPRKNVDALAARARRWRAAIHRSAWLGLVGRGVLYVLTLMALAWIGRAATAAALGPAPPVASAPAPTPITSAATPAVSAAPPPSAVPTVVPPPSVAPPASRGRATPEDPVYVNHASAEELRRLPGVGAKRAEAIVALRQRMGRFQRVEDLLRVKGIGRATLRKWRPLVRLDVPDGGAP